jgi:hypothetical protein
MGSGIDYGPTLCMSAVRGNLKAAECNIKPLISSNDPIVLMCKQSVNVSTLMSCLLYSEHLLTTRTLNFEFETLQHQGPLSSGCHTQPATAYTATHYLLPCSIHVPSAECAPACGLGLAADSCTAT